MISLREYFQKKKKDREHQKRADALLDATVKLKVYRRKIAAKIGIGLGILCVIAIAVFLVQQLRSFNGYETIISTDREDTANTEYIGFKKNIVKYSLDGISYVDSENKAMWNYTYGFQSPIVDASQETVAVGDQGGNEIYIFNEEGMMGQVKTPLPIIQLKVSEQGLAAAILEDGETTWIYLYNSDGTELVAYKTTLDNFGYPMDIAVSPDGTKIAVSFMGVSQGIMTSNIAYYNFDSVGQSFMDNLVNSVVYEGVVVPEVEFLDESTSVVFRSDGFSVFSGRQIPDEEVNITFEEEIESIFYNSQYLGFIFAKSGTEARYEMQIYDVSGKMVLERELDMDYHSAVLEGDEIILVGSQECQILKTNGTEKFYGKFAKNISTVIKAKGFERYTIISAESIDQIRLK